MKRNLVYAIAVILLVTISIRSFAVPASPYPVTITQPDGTTLTVILKGDEFHHYHTTEDGFLIVKDKEGIFNYAKVDNQVFIIEHFEFDASNCSNKGSEMRIDEARVNREFKSYFEIA